MGKGCRKEEREDAQEKWLVQKMCRWKLKETFFSFRIEAVIVISVRLELSLGGAGLGQSYHLLTVYLWDSLCFNFPRTSPTPSFRATSGLENAFSIK